MEETNISERRRTEEALRESEERLRSLFDTMGQGVAIMELVRNDADDVVDCRFLEINPAFEALTGCERNAVEGRRVSEVFPQIFLSFQPRLETVEGPSGVERYESYIAETRRWLSCYAAPFGGPDGFAVFYDDITQRKHLERRQEYLLKLSDALRPLNDAAETKLTATRILAEQLGINRAFYADADRDHLLVTKGYEEDIEPLPDRPFPMATYGQWIIEDFRAGRRLVVSEMATDARFDPSERNAHLALHIAAEVAVPLVKDGVLVAVLVVHSATPRDWTEQDFALIEETAERTWAAVERANAEAELRESEMRRHLALDAAEMGTFFYQPQEDRGEPDERMLALFGLKEGDTLNLAAALDKIIHPDDREHYRAEVAKAVDPNGEGKLYVEIRVIHPDESVHWIAVTAQTIFDGEPAQAVQMYGTAADITERKRAQEALKINHFWLTQAMQATKAGWGNWNLLTGEADWSEEGKRLVGFASDEEARTAEGWLKRVHPEDRPKIEAHAAEAFANHQDFNLEYRVIRADGEIRWLLGTGKAFYDENGTAYRSTGLVIDITDRKQAEEALRRSEGRLRALFESIDEGFSEMQVILDEEGHVVDWLHLALNGNFSRVTGIPDITGSLASEVFPNLEGEWFRRMDLAYRTGEPQRFETELAELGRWFDNYITRLGGEDDNRVFGVFGDITERKRRERQQEFLLKFSDVLRTLPDKETIEETGLRLLAEFLRLDRAYVFVLYPPEDRAVVRAEQRKENLASLLGEVRMSDFPETVRRIEDQTLVFNDIDSDARLSDLNRTSLAAVNLQAFVCTSVRKGERNVIWSLAAASATPRTWTKDEVELIETVGERMWAAAERARAEEALHTSLAEREALLQELHHRVKNNLQVITSLLEMQARQTDAALALTALSEARHRIASIALIHELLYQTGSFSKVELTSYARRLVSHLISFHQAEERIKLTVEGDEIFVNLERAVPCGLLLNELVSNVCKHALPPPLAGELTVTLQQNDAEIQVQVKDTGAGFPPAFDYRESATLGLQLVHLLTKQLGGTVVFSSKGGANVEVRLPIRPKLHST